MSQLELNTSSESGRTTLFVDVILPVPIPRMFTYRSPHDFNDYLQIGSRVIVQFGSRKILTGVIGRIHESPPTKYEAKYILDILDEHPVISTKQLELFNWIAEYYMCTLGEVFNIAIPSGLKLSSESRVQLYPEFDSYNSEYTFSDKEQLLIDILESNDSLTYSEISKALQLKNIFTVLKSLVKKEAIILFEEIKEKYKPKKRSKLRLTKEFERQELLEELLNSLVKRPKQEEVILEYLNHVPVHSDSKQNAKGIEKKVITESGVSKSAINTLIKNGVLESYEETVSRFPDSHLELSDVTLSVEQHRVEESILLAFNKKDIALLHGITGSGKTEIYISLIQKVLDNHSQVLYLLPEIALTTQIVSRLRKVFGNKVGIYHSKFSDNERVEVWNGVLSGRYQIVLGVRSSVFLPFDNLGLILVDEEHESSYKQYDPAPRYHARDVALYLAKKHSAKVLLGSATPSLESYYQAQHGKYSLIELNQRYGNAQLPEFEIANMIDEANRKTLRGEFSSLLIESITNALSKGEQAIVFQNRRGYAPYISCQQCAHIPKCQNCAVSLTYHQYKGQLICHYCGYHEPMINECVACGSKQLKTMGIGTEKLEEELAIHFPKARIQRMDLDTTRNKNSYERIITEFENRNIDILVGTQMVTKGLDFDHVNLVGVFDIDRMLHFPDFRAYERTFQLTTQVSGRAGRRDKKGKVVIQARDVEADILKDITNHDYRKFYTKEIQERKSHKYPPFTRLIGITVKHKDKSLATKAAARLLNLVGEQIGFQRVLGPQEPIINKIRNEFLVELLVKLERESIDLRKVKLLLHTCSEEILNEKELKATRIIFDVDPY